MARKSYYEYKPDYAIAPGETLNEVLEASEITQADLSRRTGLATKTINEIIKGKAPITADTAIMLENVLGIKAAFWLNLEAKYQEDLARIKAKEGISKEIAISNLYPYAEMAKRGWIPKTRDAKEKVQNLRRYFEVASLDLLENLPMAANFRRHHSDNVSFYALMAWVQKGRLEAKKIDTEPFSMQKLRKSIPTFRSLTNERGNDRFFAMQEICRKSGVALTFVQNLSKTSSNGVTSWLSANKAVITLSMRYLFEDILWFSFFHELGHILKWHSKKNFYPNKMEGDNLKQEAEADTFAADTLIPPQKYRKFIQQGVFSLGPIQCFAKEIGISSGIVAGRLAKEGLLPWNSPVMQQTRIKLKP